MPPSGVSSNCSQAGSQGFFAQSFGPDKAVVPTPGRGCAADDGLTPLRIDTSPLPQGPYAPPLQVCVPR